MDITAITTLIEGIVSSGAIIILAGLVIGYLVKRWVPDKAVQNKFIPTINAILGSILGYMMPTVFADADPITRVIYGAVAGLLSCLVYDKIVTAFGKGAQ